MTVDHTPRFHILDNDMDTVTSYNGRWIGTDTVFGYLLAEYTINGSQRDIPLPVTRRKDVFMRGLWRLFYEIGARSCHVLQRRVF
jgi:hypothetical protein